MTRNSQTSPQGSTELPVETHRTIAIEQAGVDEVSVIPWMMMLPRRVARLPRHVARRVGITRAWATMTVVLVGLFSTSVSITVLVVSLEGIAKDLNTSVTTLNWAITGPMLAFGVVGPAYGKAGDLWGHKRIFVGGLAFAGVFAVATVFAWNAASMLTFRILSAIAGSATGPSAMAYVNRLFEPHERVRPLSMWSFTTAGAPVLGVVIGGPIIESFGWRVIFIGQAPFCLIGALLAWRMLPQTAKITGVKFDVLGSVALGIGATSILLGINRGHSWGWGSAPIIGILLLGVVAVALFVRVERRAEAPLMPLAWLRTRNVALPIVCVALTNFAYMGGFIVVPQMLTAVGMTESHIGLLVIARPLSFSIAAPLFSTMTMKWGERFSGILGSALVVGSMVLLSTFRLNSPEIIVIIGLALSGVGLGMASPALTAVVANAVEEENLGVAAAMQQLMSQMGAVVGSTVMITVHESFKSGGNVSSYGYGLLTGAFTAALAIACAWFIQSTQHREDLI